MTAGQITVVRSTWRRVVAHEDRLAALFYRLLFELDPSLRGLFAGDMTVQGRKLTAMLDVVVAQLDRLGEVVPLVQQLGRRHARYGVTDAHYDAVGLALVAALRGALGAAWTPEADAAWTAAYATLAGVMRDASAPADRRA